MKVPPGATERIDPWRVRIHRFRPDMRTEGLVYADGPLWRAIQRDATVGQVADVATLPGIVGPAMAMPDAHQGYGFPIGGVAATDAEAGGAISPGGVGFDINCGVRLLVLDVDAGELGPRGLERLADELARAVPVGLGRSQKGRVGADELDEILAEGAAWAVRRGMGEPDDLAHTESGGRLDEADPDAVSQRARERGREQVGTLGAGNHFVEVQVVEELFEPATARVFGLAPGRLALMIHTGSRGLGHQVCSEAVRRFRRSGGGQLAALPVDSPEGRAYLGAMAAAANFAWANRQVLTHRVRKVLRKVLGSGARARLVWDVAHNLAKIEEHEVDGERRRLAVHRKGATRAFPPGHLELPPDYRGVGQPVLIPGSMGTASYVLVGTERAMRESFGSVCHGAGRTMSRSAARRGATAGQVVRDLAERGVIARAASKAGLVEERPEAYKDVDAVVRAVQGAGLARPVARLRPLVVIKG